MLNRKMCRWVVTAVQLLCLTLVAVTLVPYQGTAATGGAIVTSIYYSDINFDRQRFTNGVLVDFINDAQELIATIGRVNEAVQYIMIDTFPKHALAANFFQVSSVLRNPNVDDDNDNRWKALIYVPPDEFGKTGEYDADNRPATYTIFTDSIETDIGDDESCASGCKDTIQVRYFRHTTALTDTSSTVDVPAEYLPLLKRVVRQMCIHRIRGTAMDEEAKALELVALIENALLGRPIDVRHRSPNEQ